MVKPKVTMTLVFEPKKIVVYAEGGEECAAFFHCILETPVRSVIEKLQKLDITGVQKARGINGELLKESGTYIIRNDLSVKPLTTSRIQAERKKFKIKDGEVLKEKAVTLGMDEARKLLKTFLDSKEGVLTSVFKDIINR
ncbi:uncharacterized protein LOC132599474 [Lycium barbarum]|uniref:uncharacterized protein LOC132599474 n=1 Tax=Lycium barbarum TaxID=112863 RepID=UPI00293E304C|nr:uncharacterized protein LOC132599474 [Lycium barbarum]